MSIISRFIAIVLLALFAQDSRGDGISSGNTVGIEGIYNSASSAPFGPGSPGFLSTCSSLFSVQNLLLQSQTFTTSPWTRTSTGGPVSPTVTANTAIAPDSTMTASTLSLPAVTVANSYSILYQSFTSLTAGYAYTADIYVKGVVGGETLYVSTNNGSGATIKSGTIVASATQWTRFSVTWNAGAAATSYYELGIDLRASDETGQSSPQSVYIWGGQIVGYTAEMPYVPTTTVAVTANKSLNCPTGVAFRNFSTLTAYSGNPIIPQNTGTWNAGGVSDGAFVKSGSTFYSLNNCTVTGGTRNTAWSQCLYTGTGPLNWTDFGASNPVIPLAGSGWDAQYMLHAAMIPCSVSGATYCAYVSAQNSTPHSSIGLFTSTNLTTWTAYVSNPVIPATGGPTGTNYSSLPAILNCGGTFYLYSSINDNSGNYTIFWTSTNGTTWTFGGTALNPVVTGDWDASIPHPLDTFVLKNSHGFYEMTYTAFDGATVQEIGYAVSNSCAGPWWKYQAAPILTPASSGFPGYFVGDSVTYQDGTKFYLLFNNDNGTNTSAGQAMTMTDH